MAQTPLGTWCGGGREVTVACLNDVYVCVYIHECVCPDYAGIIVRRWGKRSLKVRVVWLISSSLYHFN